MQSKIRVVVASLWVLLFAALAHVGSGGNSILSLESSALSSQAESQSPEISNDQALFKLQGREVLIKAVAPNIIRVRRTDSRPTTGKPFFSAVQSLPESTPITMKRISANSLQAGEIIVQWEGPPFQLSFFDPQNKELNRERTMPEAGPMMQQFGLGKEEFIYGLGMYIGGLDRRNNRYDIWNRHHSLPIRDPKNYWVQSYLPIPFFISHRHYGVFIDNPSAATFSIGRSGFETISYRAASGDIDYYLIYGPSIERIIEGYTLLTGRPPLPPKWALGYIQSKYGYQNEEETRSVAKIFRERKIPCDALVLDLYWFDKMGDLDWNRAKFPNPEKMIPDLAKQGFKVIPISEPFVRVDARLFSDFDRHGYFGKDAQGKTLAFGPIEWIGNKVGLVDFTNPAANQAWWKEYERLLNQGIAGWWTDLGEPEDHPENMVHHGGPAPSVHNILNLFWSKGLYENQRHVRPDQRVFILSRSGFAGSQRYGVSIWSGDVSAQWLTLRNQIAIGLNAGLSGFAYWGTDIGGFNGTPTPELFVRWMQFGAFTPTFRAHGNHSAREPWQYGRDAERIIAKYIKLRYELLPYIYTYAFDAYKTGLPLMRPLVMYWPEDWKVHNMDSAYLFGREILVAPIVREGQETATIYLPAGEWYDFWGPTVFQGGQSIAYKAPLDTLPLFVRAGSIIPMGPVVDYVGQTKTAPLTLHVYPGKKETARFKLYEDDEQTYAYETGNYALTEFSARSDGQRQIKIEIGKPAGQHGNRMGDRNFEIIVHGIESAPLEVQRDKKKIERRSAREEFLSSDEGWHFDAGLQTTSIKLRSSQSATIILNAPFRP